MIVPLHDFFNIFQSDEAASLCKSIKLHTESSCREFVHLIRIAEKYKKLRKGHKNEGGMPSGITIFDNGYFTTVSGHGSLFDQFLLNKTLGDYTGKNYRVRIPTDTDYRQARLQYLPFDRCFSFSEEDVDDREFKIYE